MGFVSFNGSSCTEHEIYVWSAPDYELPEKDQQVYHVPGRSGDLVVFYGSWKNVKRSYSLSAGSDNSTAQAKARIISAWLNSAHADGYARLEDSYEDDVYRMAQFNGGITITNVLDKAALATVTFDCKPQRFLKHPWFSIDENYMDEEKAVTNNGTIPNNTLFEANPLFKVKGSGFGTLRFKKPNTSTWLYTVQMTNLSTEDYLVIDGEMQECYVGANSRNSEVTLSNGFPKLLPGGMIVNFTGVSELKVVPHTWLL